ncbi:amidohydrolase family protein, partial [Lysobacter sp. 2RAB21]
FNMRPDLVATDNPRNPRDYLSQFYFDSWVADPRALQYLLDTCGVSRVMLGTDYPFPLGEQTPGAGIASLNLGETEQARLYHGTALEWLGLSKSRFA